MLLLTLAFLAFAAAQAAVALTNKARLDADLHMSFDEGFHAGSNEEAQRWFDIQDDYDALERKLHASQLEVIRLRAELARSLEHAEVVGS